MVPRPLGRGRERGVEGTWCCQLESHEIPLMSPIDDSLTVLPWLGLGLGLGGGVIPGGGGSCNAVPIRSLLSHMDLGSDRGG